MDMELPESVLSKGKINKKQDLLIYGKQYHLWRYGIYLGIATYTDDENIGDSFLSKIKTSEGDECFQVYMADEWALK
jgi:hypothetical protein